MTLPIIDRTDISDISDITFSNSPINIRISEWLMESVTLYLWVWSGDQNKELGEPNQTLTAKLVSSNDDYINLEISDLIRSYLINPLGITNANQPTFAYNNLTPPAITGQGVFWQVVTDVLASGVTTRYNYRTAFATLGYGYNYEKNQIGFKGFNLTREKWYNNKVYGYFNQSFNLDTTVEDATTANIINFNTPSIPDSFYKCVKDPYIIVFLNKLGLWEQFSPIGKITTSNKITSSNSNRTFRDPSTIDNSYVHSKGRDSLDVLRSYTVNTGLLNENMVQVVEELVYSSKIYLIRFNGSTYDSTLIGTTVDNTYVTVDSLLTTVDGRTITESALGLYKDFQQIPVMVTDSDFMIKTRKNDKSAIDYTIKFEETNNYIL